MNARAAEIFDRRLLIVTGKGGTGKTTLAAALAICAARRGIETVAIELGDEAALPSLLSSGDAGPGDGRTPVRLAPHLSTLRIDPEVALAEYLELELGARALVSMVLRNSGFRRLLAAAPGWRELIALGKLWHLESRRDAGRPRHALLVVDAPASGHGLSLLSVPGVVLDAVRLGPLRRHTLQVQALLTDPGRTLVIPVTLLEELPVRETLELVGRLRGLGIGLGPLIANQVEPPGPQDEEKVLRLLADSTLPPAPPPLSSAAVRSCVASAAKRRALQRGFHDELERALAIRPLELPALTESPAEPGGVTRLALALEAALAPEATPAAP